jgi:hypothetical protein
VALAAIVGIAGAACSGDDVTDPRGDLRPQATIDSPDDDFDNTTDIGHAYVCVESPVAGTYGFDISGTLGGPGGNIAPIIHVDPANVTPGTCVDVAHAGEGVIFFNPNVITADETSNPGGVVLLHVRVEEARYTTQPGGPAVLLGVDTTQSADPASGDVANEKAAKLVFVYDVQPVGGEGCTPGYWKQSQHFGNWTGYDPATLFVDAGFEDVFPGMTLLEVLGQGGGGLKALGRHAVAALLNAAYGLDYGMTAQQIIDAFNAAVPDGDIEGLLGDLVAANESSCPLARAE